MLRSFAAIASSALAYAAGVFACGVVLGGVRNVLIAPRIGEIGAVLVETPVILAASWTLCSLVMGRLRPPARVAERAAVGLLALLFLLGAEATIVVMFFGETFADFLARVASPPGLIGLAGQLVFASFPLLRRTA